MFIAVLFQRALNQTDYCINCTYSMWNSVIKSYLGIFEHEIV